MSAAAATQAFTLTDAQCMREWAQQARSIVRFTALAIAAQEDGSVSYEDGHSDRWWAVRDLLSNRSAAPALDWSTPLNLVKAVAAATWHTASLRTAGDRLDAAEIQLSLGVAAECLDQLAGECADVCTSLCERAT